MTTTDETITNMGTLTETDLGCLSDGFDAGNYANAYETGDYETAVKAINGSNGFYRIGHLLGFFSTYAPLEVPDAQGDEVEHYRRVGRKLGWGFVN